MAVISQTTFSNAFFNENVKISIKISLHVVNIGLHNGLAPDRRQVIIWTNDGLGYRRIYASLGLNLKVQAELYVGLSSCS